MRFTFCITIAFCLVVMCMSVIFATEANMSQRETVLDRQVHISPTLLLVPEVAPLCDELTGITKRMIDVGNNGKLYCEIEGKGTPMVLLSGGPGCSHQIFHPYFSQAASFAQVIYYDQRGVGQSSQDTSGDTYTLKQAVEDLDQLRAALGVEKWVVLGHSYGGFLAQLYALEHPDRVLGLVLVCASPGSDSLQPGNTRQYDFMTQEEKEKIRWPYTQKDASAEQQIFNSHWNGDWKRQNFHRPSDTELARMARYEWKPLPGFREHIINDFYWIDLKGMFADFTIPTLLLEARWDLTWSALKAHTFKQNHPNGQLIVFEQSGHSPFMDEPERFFSVLDTFVTHAAKTPTPIKLPAQKVKWPAPYLQSINNLPYTGATEKAKPLFQEAKKTGMTSAFGWIHLGLSLYDGGAYPEAMECFVTLSTLPQADNLFRFTGFVWQGHILDLQGKRDEALARYRQAQKISIQGATMRYDQYGMTIDENWIAERLKTPFVRK
jgi:proline iminopeptidase